jgi:hypothetical protein
MLDAENQARGGHLRTLWGCSQLLKGHSCWSVRAVSPPGPGGLEGGGRSCVSVSERESMEATLRRG